MGRTILFMVLMSVSATARSATVQFIEPDSLTCEVAQPVRALSSLCADILADPAFQQVCESIPEENRLQCSVDGDNVTALDLFSGCGVGFKDSLIDFLKQMFVEAPISALHLAKELITLYLTGSGTAVRFGMSSSQNLNYVLLVATNPATQHAFIENMIGKSSQLISLLWTYLGHKYKEFQCQNSEAKLRSTCWFLSEILVPPAIFFAFIKKLLAASKSVNGIMNLAQSEFLRSVPNPVARKPAARRQQTPDMDKGLARAKDLQEKRMAGALNAGDFEALLRYTREYADESVAYLTKLGYQTETILLNNPSRFAVVIRSAPNDGSVSSSIINSINNPRGTRIVERIMLDPADFTDDSLGAAINLKSRSIMLGSLEYFDRDHAGALEMALVHEARHAARTNKDLQGTAPEMSLAFYAGNPQGAKIDSSRFRLSTEEAYATYLNSQEIDTYGFEILHGLRNLKQLRESLARHETVSNPNSIPDILKRVEIEDQIRNQTSWIKERHEVFEEISSNVIQNTSEFRSAIRDKRIFEALDYTRDPTEPYLRFEYRVDENTTLKSLHIPKSYFREEVQSDDYQRLMSHVAEKLEETERLQREHLERVRNAVLEEIQN